MDITCINYYHRHCTAFHQTFVPFRTFLQIMSLMINYKGLYITTAEKVNCIATKMLTILK